MATGGRDDGRGQGGILKNGTVVPNRIFIGGISVDTDEEDLRSLFSKFGNVKATKIILDKAGISKGYGFVTFETEEEANNIINDGKCVVFKERKLNIAAAIKKQPYSRTLESNSMHNSSVVWPTQAYAGGPAGYSRESLYYPQASWPFMWPHQFYLQQPCHYPPNPQASYPQYVYSIASADCTYPSMGAISGSDYSETSTDSGETPRNRSKAASSSLPSEGDRTRGSQTKPSHVPTSSAPRYSTSSMESLPNYVHSSPMHHLQSPVFAKTLNGMTVMAYPSSMMMGSPTLVHVKDGNSDSENMLTELSFLHSPMAPGAGAMTPPPTPLSTIPCDINTSMESLLKN